MSPGGVAELLPLLLLLMSISLAMMLSELLSLLLKLLHALLSFRGKSNGPEKALPDKRMMAILI